MVKFVVATLAAFVVLLGACSSDPADRGAGGTTAPTSAVATTTTVGTTATNTATTGPSPSTAPPATGPAGSALATLDGLAVAPLDTSHPYDRDAFGPSWTDDNNDVGGHNGCDTRNDMLRRDLTDITLRPNTHDCVVIGGTLADPYGGDTLVFTKSDASKVQIDHLVPLHAAWELGAWSWTDEQRIDYANDPDVLVTTSGHLNQQKSDSLADEWLPPNAAYHCTYAQKTVAVHAKYQLPVTPGEKTALVDVLAGC